jgi:hypothetical protein
MEKIVFEILKKNSDFDDEKIVENEKEQKEFFFRVKKQSCSHCLLF